jgi:hypothetical protein
MVARAEAALKALAGQFAGWLQNELESLEAARARVAREGLASDAGEALYLRAHDLKGLGATYEFPIVSRIGGSLCALLENSAERADRPLDLIDAHIEAIKATVRDNIRNDHDPAVAAAVSALESKVSALAR